ncbi:uncharacterized protein LOC120075488 isoform X2 [Benincasa hispida]|uniref:uncharacterized protein LOC120075488 isoform X2 n=1 Tax=Benincasa hispida TaxID=102211 RepID=UPI00190026DC|nr:uncharacterized protein LOC120075488 isoform X2 [Benincasa hispida]
MASRLDEEAPSPAAEDQTSEKSWQKSDREFLMIMITFVATIAGRTLPVVFGKTIPTAVFDGDNYQVWAVHMKAYMEALDIWEAVEEGYEIPDLPNNPIMAQIKLQKEKKTRKSKAKACLFVAVSSTIFTRIMTLKNQHMRYGIISSQSMREMQESKECVC